MLIYYREYPYNIKNVYPTVEKLVALIQGNYYNVNPGHVRLTCKIYEGKGHIDKKCIDKDTNYYRNKMLERVS